MKNIQLMTIFHPLPCVAEDSYIMIQNIVNRKDKRLSFSKGNVNFTDLWLSMVETSRYLEGKYVGQHVSLLSEEAKENQLVTELENCVGKKLLITFIKLNHEIVANGYFKTNLELFLDTNQKISAYKIFYTLDNADFIVFCFGEEVNLLNIADAFKEFVKEKTKNNFQSLYFVMGDFYRDNSVFKVTNIDLLEKSEFSQKKCLQKNTWCEDILKKLQQKMLTCQNNCNKKWLSYYQNVFQIVNLLWQYEQEDASKTLFYILYPPINMFIEQLEQGMKVVESLKVDKKYNIIQDIESSMGDFIDAMELLVHHIGISCANILNVDIRNGLAYDIPSRLCLLYLSVLYEVKEVLNDSNIKYEFLLAPLASSRPLTDVFEFGLEPKDRLIRVRVARHQMYSPRALMSILTHEAGHYIGDGRMRNTRVDAFTKVSVILLVNTLLPEKKFSNMLLKLELSEDEQELVRQDWWERKKRISEYCMDILKREIISYNKDRKAKYHFNDLYKEICMVIKQNILCDRRHDFLLYMNTVSIELRKKLSRRDHAVHLINVLEKERKIFEAGFLEASLSEKLYDDLSNIKTIWKEIYSDYVVVTILNLKPLYYLETYLLSESYQPPKETINNMLVNRVAMVKKIVSDHDKSWETEWNDLENVFRPDDMFLKLLKAEVDKYLTGIEKMEEKIHKSNGKATDSNQLIDEKFDPFMNYNIIRLEQEYLSAAYQKLQVVVNRPEVVRNKMHLEDVFRHFMLYEKGHDTSTEALFDDMEKIINDYQKNIKKRIEK